MGLLPPNNAQGQGAGFVSYRIALRDDAETGGQLEAQARVLLNNAPPEDTQLLTYTVDGAAPTTQLDVAQVGTSPDFTVRWNSIDDQDGSGFKHVTLYVAEDGGDFRIWQRQLQEASGELVYLGRTGHTYEFLALASDKAGNREIPPVGQTAEASMLRLAEVPRRRPPSVRNQGCLSDPPLPHPRSKW